MLNRGILSALALGLSLVLGGASQAQVAGLPQHLERTSTGGVTPTDGYVWVSQLAGDLRVKWQSGRRHSKFPHIVSAETEGKWHPTSGYRWLNDVPGDFRVVATPAASSGRYDATGSGAYRKPSKEQVANALAKVLFAMAAHHAATNGKGDGPLDEALRLIALRIRDEAIESAATDLFPGIRRADAQILRRAICLSWDGKLNERNWRESTMRDEMMATLKKYDPDLGMAVDANDFILQVMAKCNR